MKGRLMAVHPVLTKIETSGEKVSTRHSALSAVPSASPMIGSTATTTVPVRERSRLGDNGAVSAPSQVMGPQVYLAPTLVPAPLSGPGESSGSIVIAANRLPIRWDSVTSTWALSPGGLTRALIPASQHQEAIWVGWPGAADAAIVPEHLEDLGQRVTLSSIDLSNEEVEAFYDGIANRVLWPLFHDALAPSEFDASWWDTYVAVNQRFANRIASLAPRDGTVWIHDYHLLLVPAMLRRLRSDVSIGLFLHIPFPAPELFSRLPWRRELLRGMLGSDVIGVQTPVAGGNLARTAASVLLAAVDSHGIEHAGRVVPVHVRPVAVDVDDITRIASATATAARVDELRTQFGTPRRILLGVDRLDYTKGIDRRLEAFGALLAQRPELANELMMVQVAVPSRTDVAAYAAERERIERIVGEINGRFAGLGQPVVRYVYDSLDLEELVALYQLADVMLVTPRSDGMNLVAKEFVAARTDGDGVLVLSEFAGAAHELLDAVLVNPFSLRDLTDGVAAALAMSAPERQRRMARLRRRVTAWDVHAWAAALTNDINLAQLRRNAA
jgi:alpha,alpha-trehalose-phosphate synthase [UDP-forming]